MDTRKASVKKSDAGSNEDREEIKPYTDMGVPPAFAERDMENWLHNKFKPAIDIHKSQKSLSSHRGFKSIEGTNGQGNLNCHSYSKLKRPNEGR